jgi:hypothetical protein
MTQWDSLAELAKADITFERLAGALSAIKEPVREWKLYGHLSRMSFPVYPSETRSEFPSPLIEDRFVSTGTLLACDMYSD